MVKYMNVTVDGPAGAGKSTVTKSVAYSLSFRAVNTGEIYRAIAYKFLELNKTKIDYDERSGSISVTDGIIASLFHYKEKLEEFVDQLDINVTYTDNNMQRTLVDGKNVTPFLHTHHISKLVPLISPFKEIRDFAHKIQRKIARENNIVMEGRDIGTNILPDAQVKFFVTATSEERARRRYNELVEKGALDLSYEDILKEIDERDRMDSVREHGALKKPDGAFVIDTTGRSVDDVVNQMVGIVRSYQDAEAEGLKQLVNQ